MEMGRTGIKRGTMSKNLNGVKQFFISLYSRFSIGLGHVFINSNLNPLRAFCVACHLISSRLPFRKSSEQ